MFQNTTLEHMIHLPTTPTTMIIYQPSVSEHGHIYTHERHDPFRGAGLEEHMFPNTSVYALESPMNT